MGRTRKEEESYLSRLFVFVGMLQILANLDAGVLPVSRLRHRLTLTSRSCTLSACHAVRISECHPPSALPIGYGSVDVQFPGYCTPVVRPSAWCRDAATTVRAAVAPLRARLSPCLSVRACRPSSCM